ncbi:hypothetical protein IV203_006542 [Nitzschia inconspicua]|uniref:Uncharacterized protein n=1 Tax=Nitzschia inconspicua TaxID=303405 RepID=A0A9K3PA68_9STRA|nr:hypothetical protein IV203_006542 [Nitzschia inconspicua]
MTSPAPWDPFNLDFNINSDDDDFYDALEDSPVALHDHVDEYGDYESSSEDVGPDSTRTLLDDAHLFDYFSFSHNVTPKAPDFERLRPHILFKSDSIILNDLHVGNWQSEPHHQHQNPAERRWQDIKRISKDIMDRTACFPSCWLLVLCYVMFVMNHLANAAFNWDIPLQRLTGNTVDTTYPSDTCELLLLDGWFL